MALHANVVSIPQGTIKSYFFQCTNAIAMIVSIPQGTIKR